MMAHFKLEEPSNALTETFSLSLLEFFEIDVKNTKLRKKIYFSFLKNKIEI